MLVIESGKFDRRLEYQTANETKNSRGERVIAYNTVNPIFLSAMLIPVKNSERFEADQKRAFITSVFRIRYRANLSTTGRIKYHGTYYRILGIQEVGRRQCLDLFLEALEGSGFKQ